MFSISTRNQEVNKRLTKQQHKTNRMKIVFIIKKFTIQEKLVAS